MPVLGANPNFLRYQMSRYVVFLKCCAKLELKFV